MKSEASQQINEVGAPDLVFGDFLEFDPSEFISEGIPDQESLVAAVNSAEPKENKGEAPATASPTNEIDPITESIRANIIQQQIGVIKSAIADSAETDEEKKRINGMNLQEINTYLREEENKEKINEVLSDPKVQQSLNEIEVEGYKKVHSAQSYRDVTWQTGEKENTRINEIKNENGNVIVSLSETTHKTNPVSVKLSDGTVKQIDSYRTVDFPQELENGKGPLHLSMAVKDSMGNNIDESKALYFTAHYDREGNLTELSSPQPIKFAGKGEDAIGYIERDGAVYTLAVTQGQYKQLMREVEKNQGLAFDVSQEVETIAAQAPDKFQTQQQEEPQQLQSQQQSQPEANKESSPPNDPVVENKPGLQTKEKEEHKAQSQQQSQKQQQQRQEEQQQLAQKPPQEQQQEQQPNNPPIDYRTAKAPSPPEQQQPQPAQKQLQEQQQGQQNNSPIDYTKAIAPSPPQQQQQQKQQEAKGKINQETAKQAQNLWKEAKKSSGERMESNAQKETPKITTSRQKQGSGQGRG